MCKDQKVSWCVGAPQLGNSSVIQFKLNHRFSDLHKCDSVASDNSVSSDFFISLQEYSDINDSHCKVNFAEVRFYYSENMNHNPFSKT